MGEVLATLLSGALPTMLDAGERLQESLRRLQHRRLHRRGSVQGHDGRDAQDLADGDPAPGQERVLYPGLSEHEEVEIRRANGIPLHKEVIQWFAGVTSELGIEPLATL